MNKQIEIKVNGEKKSVSGGLNVTEILHSQGYDCELLAIALNETFVARTDYLTTIVEAGDSVDIVAPMQGG